MSIMSDATLLKVVDDIRSLSRPDYERLLVELGFFSLDELSYRGHEGYASLPKREFMLRTLRESEDQPRLLEALNDRIRFSSPVRRALALDGIQFGHTIAGPLAEPAKERSRLEVALTRHGLNQVKTFLDQSRDNYIQENFEAANAMTRTALEHLVEMIASRVSSARGSEKIPQKGKYIGPADYRNYLHNKRFLDDSEKRLLDSFYGYASTDGSHPGVSSEADARLRTFVVVGIALLFLEKLDNPSFMKGLI